MAYVDVTTTIGWSTCKSGGPPASGDTVCINSGGVLQMDGANSSTYTCVAIVAATSAAPTTYNQTGYMTLSNAISTIAANVTAGNADMLTMTSGANKTLTISGTITGGTAANKRGLYISSGTHTIHITQVLGGTASGAYGVWIAGGTVTGNITTITGSSTTGGTYGARIDAGAAIAVTTANGGTISTGLYQAGSTGSSLTTANGGATTATQGVAFVGGTMTITNAIGGGAAGAFGVLCSAGTATITNAKGGTATGAVGVMATTGGTVVLNGTDLTGTAYPASAYGGLLKVAAGVKLQFSNASGTLTKFYDPTLMPAVKYVVTGTSYGGGDYAGSRVDCPQANAIHTGSAYYGDPTSLTDGTLTLPDVTYVLSLVPAYGIGGTGSGGTATLPDVDYVLGSVPDYGVGGTGSGGNAVPPDHNFVLDGVEYGVGGDGSLGVYVGPAAADVKSGVVFGPSSTYTGEYAGGGGGGALSRVRLGM